MLATKGVATTDTLQSADRRTIMLAGTAPLT